MRNQVAPVQCRSGLSGPAGWGSRGAACRPAERTAVARRGGRRGGRSHREGRRDLPRGVRHCWVSALVGSTTAPPALGGLRAGPPVRSGRPDGGIGGAKERRGSDKSLFCLQSPESQLVSTGFEGHVLHPTLTEPVQRAQRDPSTTQDQTPALVKTAMGTMIDDACYGSKNNNTNPCRRG